MSLINAKEQSKWHMAKAAFHSVEWNHRVPHIMKNTLDIFCHPFNANMPLSSTPVWDPDTVRASLALRRIVSKTSSVDSETSSKSSESFRSHNSTPATSISMESSCISLQELQEVDDSGTVPTNNADIDVLLEDPTSVPYLLSGLETRSPMVAPCSMYMQADQAYYGLEHSLPTLHGVSSGLSEDSGNAILFKVSKGKDREELVDLYDPIREAKEAVKKLNARRVARERRLFDKVYKNGQGPSRFQDNTFEPIVRDSPPPPTLVPENLTPLDYAFFMPFSVIISSKCLLSFDKPTPFTNIITSVGDAANLEPNCVFLEESSKPGSLVYDDDSLSAWMVGELDNPAEGFVLKLAT